MNDYGRRIPKRFRPDAEPCEPRLLLSTARSGILDIPVAGSHPVRPNTPVLAYGTTTTFLTFLDPTVGIIAGNRIAIGPRVYVAPFAALDATAGAIRIGQNSAILDNANLVANPSRRDGSPVLTIGQFVVVSQGARILGASTVGGLAEDSPVVLIGPNAVIDNATISPNAIVSAGAVVRGVTVPSGLKVLPNAVVTTEAEASDPSLGKVVKATPADLSQIITLIGNNSALAFGYATLYQGQSNTGVAGTPEAPTTIPNLFNGNLAAVRGTSREAGSPTVSFEPSRRGPRFPIHGGKNTFEGNFANFPARITGGVIFGQSARQLSKRIGKHLSIRGDEGQPITIGSIAKVGANVTIHAPRGGKLTVGQNLRTGSNVVINGGTIGDSVSVGSGAVIENSTIGTGASIGDGAYISGSTIAPGEVVPAGAVIVNRSHS